MKQPNCADGIGLNLRNQRIFTVLGAGLATGASVALAGTPGISEASTGPHLDLRTLHVARLRARRVPEERITVSPTCTACEAGQFFSHRREAGRTGRGGALVGWRGR